MIYHRIAQHGYYKRTRGLRLRTLEVPTLPAGRKRNTVNSEVMGNDELPTTRAKNPIVGSYSDRLDQRGPILATSPRTRKSCCRNCGSPYLTSGWPTIHPECGGRALGRPRGAPPLVGYNFVCNIAKVGGRSSGRTCRAHARRAGSSRN